MSIKISIVDAYFKGSNAEHVSFRVNQDCNLHDYAVLDDTSASGHPSNKERHFYRFPNFRAKAGDTIDLFTHAGTNTPDHPRPTGSLLINLYWGLKSGATIWNQGGDTVHVVELCAAINKRV